MYEFKLPDIGEGMHEGEIRRWLVREGEQVAVDQPIVEVQTDKVTAEMPAPVAGVVSRLCAAEGSVVPVGSVLAVIDTGSDERVPVVDGVPAQTGMVAAAAEPSVATVTMARPQTARRALATPHVRSLARKLGIVIDEVPGTGPSGRVTEEDVRRASERRTTPEPAVPLPAARESEWRAASVASANAEERVPLRGVRRRIAEHMVKSVRVIPHVTHVDEMEMDELHALRDRLRPYAEARGTKLTYLPFFVKAVAVALREYPYLNASVDEDTNEVILKRYYNIGIATDTDEGLMVPVVKDADKKSVLAIAAEISDLVARCRSGKLTLQDVSGGTFTITNVGPIGGLYATPIINHPEAAILGLHKVEPRQVVRNWESVIRRMMYMSLSFDHRIIDGAMAVRFTNRLRELLENPEVLFVELV